MDEGLTEYAVRAALSAHGIAVSHHQLVTWHGWGLLDQNANGRWAPNTVNRVAYIHGLGKVVSSYARRVILLYAESFLVVPLPGREEIRGTNQELFQIPPEQLQRAMAEVAPQIRPHLRKMKAIEAAIAALLRNSGPFPVGQRPALPRRWRPPARAEWGRLLSDTPSDIFAERAPIPYYYAALLSLDTPEALDWIPFEERVVLLMIRDLAARHQAQHRVRKGRAIARQDSPAGNGPQLSNATETE